MDVEEENRTLNEQLINIHNDAKNSEAFEDIQTNHYFSHAETILEDDSDQETSLNGPTNFIRERYNSTEVAKKRRKHQEIKRLPRINIKVCNPSNVSIVVTHDILPPSV